LKKDRIVADMGVLRKGAVVQLSGGVMHRDPELWRPDVESFNVDHFPYSTHGSKLHPDGSISEGKTHALHSTSFRSFGRAAILCPGRHCAHMEVLGLAAKIIMGV
jgi:cytochrome P450